MELAGLWEEAQEPAQWVKSSQDSASMSDVLGTDCRACPSGQTEHFCGQENACKPGQLEKAE